MSFPSSLRVIFVACVLLSAAGVGAAENAAAKAITEVSGIRAGLCVHLGCGRAESSDLTAALAENPALLVHGLALDEASLVRARKAIEARGLGGRAMVESVELKPLPYVADLANLVVIEDMKAVADKGVTKDELLRVLAPGGALCVLENGKWTKTVKARSSDMDDWTHPRHGADGNMVSTDKIVKFPLGFRWIDGLPVNVNRWAACRGWVIANGRCFTLSSNEMENLGAKTKEHFLTARDSFNGLPLWKINVGTTDDGAFLTYENAAALAADDKQVYAVLKNKAIAVDAASGKIIHTFDTKYTPERLTLLNGVLIAACWEGRDASKADFDKNSLWATWISKNNNGSVEAFDIETGQLKWSMPMPAEQVLAADGAAYVLTQVGNPPTERTVIAVDLQTGKERWRAAHTKFGPVADLQLNCAGYGFVVVGKRKEKIVEVLSASDGRVMWQTKPGGGLWTPVVDGLLWHGSKKYDPLTGEVKGTLATGLGDQGCTPSAIVGPYVTRTRGSVFTELPDAADAAGKSKTLKYTAARGACMEGMVPANGMFYTAQNNCRCSPGQVYGFIAVGPSGDWPSAADFEKSRAVEKGPAFGTSDKNNSAEDWPMFRQNAERSSGVAVTLPENLAQLWSVPLAKPADGPVADAWKPRLASSLTAPVVAGGVVFSASSDEGVLIASEASSGKKIWSATLGGRIDSPPTIHNGLCLIGSHDGFIYALSAKDGKLAWRTRVAPADRRMIAYGQVESVWPTVGTVLVHDNIAYANAGRTSESDGGIAVVALDPATGAHVWGKEIGTGPLRQNDFLYVRDGAIAWHHVRIDPKTGKDNPPAEVPKDYSQGGMLDGTWTLAGKRRSGKAFIQSKTVADLMAWTPSLILTPSHAIPRDQDKPLWGAQVPPGCQVEAMAMAANVAVYAGRVKDATGARGVLYTVSLKDGKKLSEIKLDSPPVYDGIAIARGKVYVTLQNGTLLCFGQQ